MSQTESDAPEAAPNPTAPRRRSPPTGRQNDFGTRAGPVNRGLEIAEEHPEPVVLSQTIRRMNRRRTRVVAVLSLLFAITGLVVVIDTFVPSGSATPIEQATGEAWAATTALSDGLRTLTPGDDLQPLRGKAREARSAVQRAGKRMKTLTLPISQTPGRVRVNRALRADDAWVAAIGATLANPRSPRRAALSRLAQRAAIATALIASDVDGAKDSVSGTGRLLSATKPG